MSVRNAGAVIKKMRESKGYTQEYLSEGICSVLSLSRIENGKVGISPTLFKHLMARMGVTCDYISHFSNKDEFNIFRKIQSMFFFIDNWQLEKVIALLNEIKVLNYADNVLYFQQCQLAYATVLAKTSFCNYNRLNRLILDTLHLTCSDFSCEKANLFLYSITELRLLILLSESMILLHRIEDAFALSKFIDSYLNESFITLNEKIQLLSMNAIIMSHAYIIKKNYSQVLEKTVELK